MGPKFCRFFRPSFGHGKLPQVGRMLNLMMKRNISLVSVTFFPPTWPPASSKKRRRIRFLAALMVGFWMESGEVSRCYRRTRLGGCFNKETHTHTQNQKSTYVTRWVPTSYTYTELWYLEVGLFHPCYPCIRPFIMVITYNDHRGPTCILENGMVLFPISNRRLCRIYFQPW